WTRPVRDGPPTGLPAAERPAAAAASQLVALRRVPPTGGRVERPAVADPVATATSAAHALARSSRRRGAAPRHRRLASRTTRNDPECPRRSGDGRVLHRVVAPGPAATGLHTSRLGQRGSARTRPRGHRRAA